MWNQRRVTGQTRRKWSSTGPKNGQNGLRGLMPNRHKGTKKGLTGQGADGSPGDQAAYYEQQVKIEILESWGNQKSPKYLKAMGPKAGGETTPLTCKYYNKC